MFESITEKPIEKKTLEDWAKFSLDLAKVAIISIPVTIYGDEIIVMKIINCLFLGIVASLMVFALIKVTKLEKEMMAEKKQKEQATHSK